MTNSPSTQQLHLTAFLPYRLSVLSNTISSNIAALYDREFGLSIWQWRVMAVVGGTPAISATEIGQRTAMDKVAVSRAVSGLIQLEYLERKPSKDDARRSSLTLTPLGQSIYEQIVPIALDAERNLLTGLTDEDRQALTILLNKLAATAAPDRDLW